jgi:hypothetical protein
MALPGGRKIAVRVERAATGELVVNVDAPEDVDVVKGWR